MKEAGAAISSGLRERVFLVSPAGIGGVQTLCVTLAQAFHDVGYEVDILFERSEPGREQDPPVPSGVTSREFVSSQFDNSYHVIKRMAKLIHEARYDFVYPNTSAVTYRALGMLGPHRPTAIGGCLGNWEHDYACNTEFVNYLDHIFADSSMGAEELRRRLTRCNIGITAIPHGLKRPIEESRRDFSGLLRLVFVSRHVAYKRVPDLLEAARRLRELGVEFHLCLAGDGPLRDDLERQARELSLGGVVEFRGFVTQDQLEELMRTAHLTFLLSESEGFGIVALEGMKCGCVPIVTTNCGCREAIRDGVNGFIVGVGDVATVADRVRLLDRDRARLASMSEAASRTVREDYTLEREVARHLEVLRLAQEHHQRHAARTIPWKYEPPTLMNYPWVPNWLARNLRRLKYCFAASLRPGTPLP